MQKLTYNPAKNYIVQNGASLYINMSIAFCISWFCLALFLELIMTEDCKHLTTS